MRRREPLGFRVQPMRSAESKFPIQNANIFASSIEDLRNRGRQMLESFESKPADKNKTIYRYRPKEDRG